MPDEDLQIRDGDEHSFYAQFNKVDKIRHVVVAYENGEAVGCGAIKEYAKGTAEIKRMFVRAERRGAELRKAFCPSWKCGRANLIFPNVF